MEIIAFLDKKTLNLINFSSSSYCFDTDSFLEVRYESKFNKIKSTDMTFWELSKVKKLSDITASSPIANFFDNSNILLWNVSNVETMDEVFLSSKFNGDISRWNVSKVKSMYFMFYDSLFTGDISKWDVSNVIDMTNMFCASKFNGDISKWDVGNVGSMAYMFSASKFNGDISYWNLKNDIILSGMFASTNYKGNLKKWNVNIDKIFEESESEEGIMCGEDYTNDLYNLW
jgi:surface protein